jgi:surfeit locus 1 family protein
MTKTVPRWLVVLFGALLAAGVTARLGVWQLDRAQQKRALQANIERRATLSALDETTLAATPEVAAQQHYRPVHLRGRWLAERTVFLDNRQMAGHVGFIVVTPLRLADGSAVLVQRGWVPRDMQQRTRLPQIDTPGGDVDVRGRIAPPPSKLLEFDALSSGPIRQNLDIGAFAAEIGGVLRPLSLQEHSADAGLAQDWTLPALDVSMHLGYAFQWFALSALIAGLYVWFQLVRPRLAAKG